MNIFLFIALAQVNVKTLEIHTAQHTYLLQYAPNARTAHKETNFQFGDTSDPSGSFGGPVKAWERQGNYVARGQCRYRGKTEKFQFVYRKTGETARVWLKVGSKVVAQEEVAEGAKEWKP